MECHWQSTTDRWKLKRAPYSKQVKKKKPQSLVQLKEDREKKKGRQVYFRASEHRALLTLRFVSVPRRLAHSRAWPPALAGKKAASSRSCNILPVVKAELAPVSCCLLLVRSTLTSVFIIGEKRFQLLLLTSLLSFLGIMMSEGHVRDIYHWVSEIMLVVRRRSSSVCWASSLWGCWRAGALVLSEWNTFCF